ncbi:MAG: hypothetical protein ACFE9Z_13395 [Promethearchaeota archaeon]
MVLGSLIFIFPVTSLSTPYTQMEKILYIEYSIVRSFVFYIPHIFTMGLIFILIGIKHKENMGQFLMYCGIFWVIYFTWASICLYDPELSTPGLGSILELMGILAYPYYLIVRIALGVGSITNILAFDFFIVYNYISNDRNLKNAGLIYIIGPSLMELSMIPYYLSLWL